MRNRLWHATCASIAFAMTAAAAAQPAADRVQSSKDTTLFTARGCLQRADQPSDGSLRFVLVDAMPGIAGSSSKGQSQRFGTYRLDADDSALTPHIDHRIEVKGVLEENSIPTNRRSPSSSANPPKLKVESVKLIASYCA